MAGKPGAPGPVDPGPGAPVRDRRRPARGALAASAAAWLGYAIHAAAGAGPAALGTSLLLVAIAAAATSATLAGWGQPRGPWPLLGGALVAYGLSAVAYASVPDAALRFPSVLDVGLFAFYPLAFAAVVRVVRRQFPGFSGAMWLDAAITSAVLMAVAVMLTDPALTSVVEVGQLLYVLGDVAFVGILGAAWMLSGRRGGRSVGLLVAGAGTLAVADAVYLMSVQSGTLAPGLLSLVLWPAALLTMAAAASSGVRPMPVQTTTWTRIAIPVGSATASAPIVFFYKGFESLANVFAWAALALTLARMALSLLENGRLLSTAQETALTDRLTGLANRRLLHDRLEQALLRRRRRGGAVAALFIDVDDFKAVNDTHGHDVGDQVLVALAERIRVAVRAEDTLARASDAGRLRDTIARLGGDEFVVVLEELGDPGNAALVADRLLAALAAPLSAGNPDVALSCSIGISVTDGTDGRGPVELLRDADIAMYEAKRSGKGRYQLFEVAMRERILAQTRTVRDLRRAIEQDELRLFYQPQVDLASGRMTGVEALVRWQHPDRGLVMPDQFIPVAEQTGMIVPVDDWVLREACRQMREWDDAGLCPLQVAVNVSARRLVTGDLAATLADIVRATGADATRLEIEITETFAVEHDDKAVEVIEGVRRLGVRVAIDDFGMGYSALSRLQSFPVDRLKIDRSFVASLTCGTEDTSIAAAMIAMARSLDLRVVAEGVETDEHATALRRLGCPVAQGYLFGRPVPPAELVRRAQHETIIRAALRPEAGVDRPAEETPARRHERLIRNLLAELERLTGLESTYLTNVDTSRLVQTITHSRNAGTLDIPEGLAIDWGDTVCRRALEQGVRYTDDVPGVFADSPAGQQLGLQTYASVPVMDEHGEVCGTLCGASRRPVALGEQAIEVMQRFADVISGSRDRDSRGSRTVLPQNR